VQAPAISSPQVNVQLANLAASVSTEAALVGTRAIQQREEARRSSEFASLKAKTHRIIGDEALNSMQLPPEQAEQGFLSNLQPRLQELLDGIEDDVVRQSLEEALPGMVETRRFNVAKDAFGREINEGRDDLQSNVLPELAESYAGAQSDREREDIARDARQALALSQYFNSAEKAELQKKWDAAAQAARIHRLLNEGDPDTAKLLIEDREATPDIGDEERLSLRNTIDGELGKIAEREWSNLEVEIDRAGPNADFDALESEVDRLFDEGAIGGPKRVQLKGKVQERRAEVEDLVARRERIWAAWDEEPGALLFPRNKDDRDDVAEFYESSIRPQLAAMNPAERAAANVQTSVRLNMVPKPLEEEIHAKIRGGTTEQVIEAANYLEGIRTSDKPELMADFSDEDVATGMLVASSMRAGLRAEDAVEQARKALRASPQERDVREDRWIEEDWTEIFRFQEFERRWRETETGTDQMRGEFEFLVKTLYLNTGDIDVAQDMATDAVNRIYAVTNIHTERYQRLAPEAMYPEFRGDSDAILEQVVTDLLTDAINNEVTLPETEGWAERIRLEPDAITQRQVYPSYVIAHQSESGEWEPIEMKDGQIARFTPDYISSPAFLHRQQKIAAQAVTDRERDRRADARRRALAEHPELAQRLELAPLVLGRR
jgi:hypothetical protein